MEKVILRLLKDWNNFRKGSILKPKRELSALTIKQLINQGIVERYEEKEER